MSEVREVGACGWGGGGSGRKQAEGSEEGGGGEVGGVCGVRVGGVGEDGLFGVCCSRLAGVTDGSRSFAWGNPHLPSRSSMRFATSPGRCGTHSSRLAPLSVQRRSP